ncbi:MAG TPA: hypothetical protein VMW41_06175 [Candidatus Bathyarchaeia archaeon]|nr:hypothetical protein [Candidatus Bathyarchaeia archaeon]
MATNGEDNYSTSQATRDEKARITLREQGKRDATEFGYVGGIVGSLQDLRSRGYGEAAIMAYLDGVSTVMAESVLGGQGISPASLGYGDKLAQMKDLSTQFILQSEQIATPTEK